MDWPSDGFGDCRDSILIASDPNSKVLGLVAYAWAGFGAAFGPVVILSVLWKRITAYGALSGMIAGALTVVVWAEWIKNLLWPHKKQVSLLSMKSFQALSFAHS